MTAPETLIPRLSRRDIREYVTRDNDLVIARQLQPGSWLVTAHSADLRGEAQGRVVFNEAGFRGRQWTSDIDGQEYPSLIAAMREAVSKARREADIVAFLEATPAPVRDHTHRVDGNNHVGCPTCETDFAADAAWRMAR